MPDSRDEGHHPGDREGGFRKEHAAASDGSRRIEKDKWALLGLAFLIAGAVVLGMLTHAESLEVRDAMKDIKLMLSEEMKESGES